MWLDLVQVLFAYLLGSIPFGLIASKLTTGIDPRAHGSGNVGFTNVLRVVGKKAGAYALVGDVGKGLVATAAIPIAFPGHVTEPRNLLLIGFAVVIGHCYSVFLGFRGGKGVATALGAILGIDPILGLVLLGVWLLAVAIWKYAALGALIGSGLLPVMITLWHPNVDRLVFGISIAVLIWLRHRGNLDRLLAGTEPHITAKRG
ncbi:MAG TPA: glycerol-3-phosphate 1-O-acyltransferase [Nitrospirales bacterium]|nr:glycerol-3-phosphate 1-O-acyltransferase PlsY [Nitrospirales bacterium]HIO22350.1 glycerol-3-phosphate 1-O-acyltransferase [Nitrospirales bacterium]